MKRRACRPAALMLGTLALGLNSAVGAQGEPLAAPVITTPVSAADSVPVSTPVGSDVPAPSDANSAADPATIAVAVPAEPAPVTTSPAAPSVGIGLEEIVVTAQRREQSANDVPIAISAFSGHDLQALGVVDTRDLGKIVPGFTAADSGGNTPVYTLRGIGFNDQTYTATSTVGVYVDEVSLPYSIMTKGANLDLQRVEVLKGPQGTLYGRNTTGGAINYIANKPGDQLEAGITAGYSSFETTELEGFVSGPVSDSVRARLALRDVRSQQGWQYSQTRPGDTLGRVDKQAGRGLLDWTPSEELKFQFVLSGWSDHGEPQAPQAIALQPQNAQVGALALAPEVRNYPLVPQDTDNTRVADWSPAVPWRLRDSYWQGSGRMDWLLSDTSTLTTIASHGKVKSDGDNLPQSGLDVLNAEQKLIASVSADSLEVRLAGKQGDDVNWLLGVNGAHDRGDELHKLYTDTVSSLFPNPVNLPPATIDLLDSLFPTRPVGRSLLANRVNTYGKTEATTLGLFANADWQFTDTLQYSLGLRYSNESRKYEGCTFEDPDSEGLGLGPLITATAALRGNVLLINKGDCITLNAQGQNDVFHGRLKNSNISGRTALNWTPQKGQLYYASLTRGFKSGGFPVLNASDQSQLAPVKPEELLAAELGAKLTLIDGLAQINAAVFDYKYKDKQLLTRKSDPIFGPVPLLLNAPKSKVQGAELELQLTPLHGLFLSGAASYIDTKIEEFVGTGFDGNPVNFAGRPFNFAPRVQYSALADYEFAVTDDYLLGLSTDYSYTSKTNSTLEGNPNYAHRAFGLINARVRISDAQRSWTATAWARNLTDEFSQVSVFNIGDAVARYAGMPRTYGVTLAYRFE